MMMGLKRSSCAARFANGASCSGLSFAGIASAMIVQRKPLVGIVCLVVELLLLQQLHRCGHSTRVRPAFELWAAV